MNHSKNKIVKYTIQRNNKVRKGLLALSSIVFPLIAGVFFVGGTTGCKKPDPVIPVDTTKTKDPVDLELEAAGVYGSQSGHNKGAKAFMTEVGVPIGAAEELEVVLGTDGGLAWESAAKVSSDSLMKALYKMQDAGLFQEVEEGYFYAEVPAEYQKFFPSESLDGSIQVTDPWVIAVGRNLAYRPIVDPLNPRRGPAIFIGLKPPSGFRFSPMAAWQVK